MAVTAKPAKQTEATAARTPGHAWAHQCEICGEGAAFGCADRQGVTHWFCGDHRQEGERRTRRV